MIKRIVKYILGIISILLVIVILSTFFKFYIYPKYKTIYTAQDFGIEIIQSKRDNNHNGVNDYLDLLYGARRDAQNKPIYKSAYYSGGYPPETEGVCTDVIWRAFANAGYVLKDMIDEDIRNNVWAYPRVNGKPDPNIDFRRVPNLQVFFERNANKLTIQLDKIEQWQPGDIVIFGNTHIGIISDKRNKQGIPYLIHNGGQPNREEDILILYNQWEPITGHYRMKL